MAFIRLFAGISATIVCAKSMGFKRRFFASTMAMFDEKSPCSGFFVGSTLIVKDSLLSKV